ncbi:MAG: VanW family protein [Polyangiales bacterium]
MYSSAGGLLAREARSLERLCTDTISDTRFARLRQPSFEGKKVYRHQSVLVRRRGQSQRGLQLQRNKVRSLRVAVACLQDVTIRPGETFSFWKLVGRPTQERGFALGMELSAGRPQEGVGGGLCQLSNLIFWLALHSSLGVVERHHHSFDPFPDDGRVLPFGSGATVMYRYKDLRLFNPTDSTFRFRFGFDAKCLRGLLQSDASPSLSYSVFERDPCFVNVDGRWRRRNAIWRRVRIRTTGRVLRDEFLFRNDAEVRYDPDC